MLLQALFFVQLALAQPGPIPLPDDSPINEEGRVHLLISVAKPLAFQLANLEPSLKNQILDAGFIMIERDKVLDPNAVKQLGGLSRRSGTVCSLEIEPAKLRSALAQVSLSLGRSFSVKQVRIWGNQDSDGEVLFTDILFQYPAKESPTLLTLNVARSNVGSASSDKQLGATAQALDDCTGNKTTIWKNM